jgi:hypothetical protein
MSVPDLNPLQTTIKDLQVIVDKNQGVDHEAALLVKQMQQLISEMERKAKGRKSDAALPKPPLGVPIQPIQATT